MCRFRQFTVFLALTLLVSNVVWADPTKPEYLLPATDNQTANSVPSVVASAPVLSYIQIGQQRSAVINGQLLKVGDQIANYRVQQIDARQVVLQQGEQRLVLKLFQTMKK